MGRHDYGRLGLGEAFKKDAVIPTKVDALHDVLQVSAAGSVSLVVAKDGTSVQSSLVVAKDGTLVQSSLVVSKDCTLVQSLLVVAKDGTLVQLCVALL